MRTQTPRTWGVTRNKIRERRGFTVRGLWICGKKPGRRVARPLSGGARHPSSAGQREPTPHTHPPAIRPETNTCTIIGSPNRNLPRAAPPMGAGACGPAKWVLDERRFTPPNIEARPSASGARRRSYTRGSEVFKTITITMTRKLEYNGTSPTGCSSLRQSYTVVE